MPRNYWVLCSASQMHPLGGRESAHHTTEGGSDTKPKPRTSFQAYSCFPSLHQVPQQVLRIHELTSSTFNKNASSRKVCERELCKNGLTTGLVFVLIFVFVITI